MFHEKKSKAMINKDISLILYEILVPTMYGDTEKPIRTKHHKEWDNRVIKITGGLTLFSPGKGSWVYQGILYQEKVIPVRILCTEKDMKKIILLTLKHYRQKAVMYYEVSRNVKIISLSNLTDEGKKDGK